MAVEGAIAAVARRQLPVVWDALADDERFGGEDSLTAVVEYVKESLFGSVISSAAEAAVPRIVQQFAGILVALELIEPGIDFFANVSIQESTRGPDETTLYANRAAELRALRPLLLEKRGAIEQQALPLIPLPNGRRRTSFPRTNTVADEFLTPSHQEFGRPYRPTARS